jgi:hypothetical protein
MDIHYMFLNALGIGPQILVGQNEKLRFRNEKALKWSYCHAWSSNQPVVTRWRHAVSHIMRGNTLKHGQSSL